MVNRVCNYGPQLSFLTRVRAAQGHIFDQCIFLDTVHFEFCQNIYVL